MKSNRLQNKDPVDRDRTGREVTIKMRLDSDGGFGLRVLMPLPQPSPTGEGENTCVAFCVDLMRFDALTPALSHGRGRKHVRCFLRWPGAV
jgi:hypothetical protein